VSNTHGHTYTHTNASEMERSEGQNIRVPLADIDVVIHAHTRTHTHTHTHALTWLAEKAKGSIIVRSIIVARHRQDAANVWCIFICIKSPTREAHGEIRYMSHAYVYRAVVSCPVHLI